MTPAQLLDCARRRIADVLIGEPEIARQLGTITLHDDQWRGACQALGVVRQQGGVLVANDVGSGKTFLALAVARVLGRVTIVAPAALRATWEKALHRSDMQATILSVESLSYGPPPASDAVNVIIIDESHHLRNPDTKRYTAVATLCANAQVILLSATPLQNRRADIAAQLALFLGTRAFTLDDGDLASLVIRRRDAAATARLPELSGPHRVDLAHEDDWLDALVSLPAPLPPADGGDGGALLSYTLVRRWASSQAALIATLERRLAAALAIESALESGRLPTRAELSAWSVADSAMQLAFPELITTPGANGSVPTLLSAVRQHADAVRSLLRAVRAGRNPDAFRADALRAIRSEHPREIIIAFSEFAETVSALGKRLALDGGVAWLTSRGGYTATARIPRQEILAQFAPDAVVARAERISLLVTTDVLSEGLDLQRASVIVHLDLPWNPARLEQRVGRVRRIGSQHACVTVYSLAPPASSDRLTRIEQRLREKITLAARSVGVAGRILPSLFTSDDDATTASAAEARGEILRIVSGWHAPREASCDAETPVVAVTADVDGFLAALDIDGRAVLVADLGGAPSTDDCDLLRAIEAMSGCAVDPEPGAYTGAMTKLLVWWERRRGSAALDLRRNGASGARRRALTRLSAIAARTPRHARARLTPQLELARSAVTAELSAGSERVLGTLVASSLPDDAWLRAIAAFGEAHVAARGNAEPKSHARATVPLIAMILLVASRKAPRTLLFTP
jgi:helicase-like protein/SNF2 domain-containing protein